MIAIVIAFGSAIVGALLGAYLQKRWTPNPSAGIVALREQVAAFQQRIEAMEQDRADKARHDKIVTLVDRMLELNKKKHSGKLAPSQLDRLEREIASTDAAIDELVYELYGITDEERKIIERSATSAL